MRWSHQGDRCECRRGSRGEDRKWRRCRDERFPIGNGHERTGLRAYLRSLREVDVATAPENFVEHVRREKNICNGVFDADRRFVADRRVDGEPRGGSDQPQRFAVSEFQRLEEYIDVTINIAARCRAHVEYFDEFRTSGGGERHPVDAQRVGEMRAYDLATLRGHRRERIVERKKKRARRRGRAPESRGDRLPRRWSSDDDRAQWRRGKKRRGGGRYDCKQHAERTQVNSRALLPRRRLRRAYPVR